MISYHLNPKDICNFKEVNIFIYNILSDHIFIKNYTSLKDLLSETELKNEYKDSFKWYIQEACKDKEIIFIFKRTGICINSFAYLGIKELFIPSNKFNYYYFGKESSIIIKDREKFKYLYNSSVFNLCFVSHIKEFEIINYANCRKQTIVFYK